MKGPRVFESFVQARKLARAGEWIVVIDGRGESKRYCVERMTTIGLMSYGNKKTELEALSLLERKRAKHA